jgi:hypothetical protein
MRPLLTLVLVCGLAACTEDTQVTVYEQGEYKGKPDELPWNNAPLAYGEAQWEKGNKLSWEHQLARRVKGQNEAIRIEHP